MIRNSIDRVFRSLAAKNKKAFIVFLTAGYPNFRDQGRLIQNLDEAGVDIVELGVPFSDPIADGPTIQFSSHESLMKGTNLRGILRFVRSIKLKVKAPVVLMSYINPLLKYGLERFSKEAGQSGVSGLIVPDLIIEEGKEIADILGRNNIHLIFLTTPTTPRARQKVIAGRSKGFLYAVSVTGVTGARRNFSKETKDWLKNLGTMTDLPVCVGFGISGVDQIRQLKKNVDGFIVGSAIIDILKKNKDHLRNQKVVSYIKKLSKECFYGR